MILTARLPPPGEPTRRKSDSIKQEPDDHHPSSVSSSSLSLAIAKFNSSSSSADLKGRPKGIGGQQRNSSKEGETILPFVSITPIMGKGDAQVGALAPTSRCNLCNSFLLL